jgi:hypothetical protein
VINAMFHINIDTFSQNICFVGLYAMEAVIAGSSSYILLGLVLLLGYMFKEEHKMCCFSSIANSLSRFTWDCGRLSWSDIFGVKKQI